MRFTVWNYHQKVQVTTGMHSHGAKDKPNRGRDYGAWTAAIPQALAESWSGMMAAWRYSLKLRMNRHELQWDPTAVRAIRRQLKNILSSHPYLPQGISSFLPLQEGHSDIRGHEPDLQPTDEEQELVHRIQEAAAAANRSNVTRTKAYLDCYESHPELHWAFLAHMVSRNAGWNMSDLKGGLMSDLMAPPFQNHLYSFLERCNALIFQDAYPQLLLYMHSRKIGKPLFHLLPRFHVSSFMTPFWERFWHDQGSSLLTVALIINEQNYIEGRVARHPFYRQHILQDPLFRMHELTRLNQIVFPLGHNQQTSTDSAENPVSPTRPLAGLTIPKFEDLSIRIKAGRSLYALLFGYEDIYHAVLAFARSTKHQGSRAEYWPALFTPTRDQAMDHGHEGLELIQSEWLPDGRRLYSPRLEEIWQDETPEPIPRYDWYHGHAMFKHIRKPKPPMLPDITHAHRAVLEKTSIAHDVSDPFHRQ
ncbi:DUF2515 family protein [Paenibacillus sp. JNUCC32]|nr:DUF2515 family protein [Paenibacillus sp. JNUCC-32]